MYQAFCFSSPAELNGSGETIEKDILIVDAYNMIGNWPDLTRLKLAGRLEEARDNLLAILSEYHKYQKLKPSWSLMPCTCPECLKSMIITA